MTARPRSSTSIWTVEIFMRKKVVVAAALIVVFFSLITANAYAHQGRTDAAGGHTNHSTGDYHYHHGYSAHEHYDMNGDGILDCPYDFKDKTNSDSGKTDLPQSNPKTENIYHYKTEEVRYVPSIIWFVIASLCAIIVFLVALIRKKTKELADQIEKFRISANEEFLFVRDGVTAINAALEELHGEDYLYEIFGAPVGDYVDEYILPHSSGEDDRYTFYMGGNPRYGNPKYHTKCCMYGKINYPINAVSIKKDRFLEPCGVCRPTLPDTEWVNKYGKCKALLKKYAFSMKNAKINYRD